MSEEIAVPVLILCTEKGASLSLIHILAEAAVRLFALMRQMDENDAIDVIVAEPVPEAGLGRAIMDRLRRASASRE